PGGAPDPEELAAQNHVFRDHVRDRVVAHGGVVCAGTGGTSLAVFGAPVAHEDDAVRAIRAAMAGIGDWPGAPKPRAGVRRGGGVDGGTMGGCRRTEADGLGVLAQPGEVALDEPVRELAGPAETEPVPGPGPPAWRLTGLSARGAATIATRFVGRRQDLAVL